jgi:DtxR family Mn-dependent transcriptional regulator
MVSTNTLAHHLNTTPASVTDMVKRLHGKDLLIYERYKGVTLSAKGRKVALNIIRKHRLWEVFLVEKLDFSWDNVHHLAEQLEHINSPELIRRLDDFLENPKFDPHGDPIPSESGEMQKRATIPLTQVPVGREAVIAGVSDDDSAFLQYLDRLQLNLGQRVWVREVLAFDKSVQIEREQLSIVLSGKVAQRILVLLAQ